MRVDRVASPEDGFCRLGVVSDTHGRLDADTERFLEGSDAVLHAGDVGDPMILTRLEGIAPVYAVRGNVDRAAWALELPVQRVVEACGRRVVIGHILDELLGAGRPERRGFDVVVFGHSHEPREEWRDGVLFLNPGSAGPRRFHLPRAAARLTVGPEGVEVETAVLEQGSPRRR